MGMCNLSGYKRFTEHTLEASIFTTSDSLVSTGLYKTAACLKTQKHESHTVNIVQSFMYTRNHKQVHHTCSGAKTQMLLLQSLYFMTFRGIQYFTFMFS